MTVLPDTSSWALWLTGLPASGKSSITAELMRLLEAHGVQAAVLESDVLRRELTPDTSYSEADRQAFYRTMVYIGRLLAQHGVPVIFDATANRRAYRDAARAAIPRFLEVLVDCPVSECARRDPKHIYREAGAGRARNVPGVDAEFEPPLAPELIIPTLTTPPNVAAQRIFQELRRRGWLN